MIEIYLLFRDKETKKDIKKKIITNLHFESLWKIIDKDKTGKIMVEDFHNVL